MARRARSAQCCARRPCSPSVLRGLTTCALRVALAHPGSVLHAVRASAYAVARGSSGARDCIEGLSAGAVRPVLCSTAPRHAIAWGSVLAMLRSIASALHDRIATQASGMGQACILWHIGSRITAFKLAPRAVSMLESALRPSVPARYRTCGPCSTATVCAVVNTLGTRARCLKDEAVSLHMELVRCIARRHAVASMRLGDLIQEGVVGLVRALDRYRCKGGCQFTTYASWWVRQHVVRTSLARQWDGRIPPALYGMLCRIRMVAASIIHRNGHRPTPSLVARELGIPSHDAESALVALSAYHGARSMPGAVADLVACMGEVHTRSKPAAGEASGARNVGSVAAMTVREASILRLRLGAWVGARLTLGDIGRRFGITRERVRQIEARVLKRARRPMLPCCAGL
ncbi:RNA polymerase sigma factor RpoD [Candidatus Tremblaya princeps]|uniref:RNA polymerase sigma factor RpoD n=1 Tax=Tremblaya princeps TaxID=189385 RepID=A0A143WMQ2_TREPR|nr:RNA polymerase sigma factor RpoD [Candidatus Tremblaya princeps]